AIWSKSDFSVRFETEKATWDLIPCGTSDLEIDGKKHSLLDATNKKVEEFRTGYSVGLLATLSDFPDAEGLKIFLSLHLIGNEAEFEAVASEEEAKITSLYWPKAVRFDTQSPDDFSVIPFMQGALIPANWEKKMNYEGGLCETRFLYMPWWGQIREGRGIQCIIETPFDGGAKYVHPEGGPTKISPRWYSSLGALRYPRRIRYVFDDGATYVSMAKRYRRYAKETGHFVSLKEKLARNPAVDEVIGKPVIHIGSLYHFVPESQFFNKEKIEVNHNLQTFDRLAEGLNGLKENGLDDAYVHLDGWGYRGYDSAHPDVLPVGEEQGGWKDLRNFAKTCKDLGYLFAVHDNYRDFYLNAVSFNEQLALESQNGKIHRSATWCGGDQSLLSARFAPGYVRRNHDLFKENGVDLGGAYLDVFAVADLDESFQEANPMTREDCAKFRLECFSLLRARGYVVSSEEPVDYAVPDLDLVHHGPYPTYPNLGGGEAVGIPVPLFNLVYHDSILLPWEMGEDGGWGIPKGDAGWLHCILNSGLPYVSPGQSKEQIEKVNEVAALARRLAFAEMVNHEFLDDSKRKQRTTYSDGTKVTVDFETKEYEVDSPE
ncbi:MAG: hypothetical protein KC978_19255, partial [Candidatus Omnitrophica bacterium]|nr:hypothetical protein [Candidatus Omnitrophota bacterium]